MIFSILNLNLTDYCNEYFEVLNISKFSDFKKNADFLLISFCDTAVIAEPEIKINLINDEPDNRFLELAQAIDADFIITGNSTDFTMENFMHTKIVSPKEFWESL